MYNPLNYEAVHYSSYKSDIYSLLYNNTLLLAQISLLLFTHLNLLKKMSFFVFSLTLFFFFSDCHTRFMPPIWPQRETEISSWFHFVRLIFLSLWPWQPVTVRRLCVHRRRTQTHILCVLVTCAQKMSLSTSRETDRGGAVGLLGGWEKERMSSVDLWFCEKPGLVFLSYQQRMDKDWQV